MALICAVAPSTGQVGVDVRLPSNEPTFPVSGYDSGNDSSEHESPISIYGDRLFGTPPTSPETLKPALPLDLGVHSDEQAFLSDLRNYIALGAIRVPDTIFRGANQPILSPSDIEHEEYPGVAIATLVESGWIRTNLVVNLGHPTTACQQIYVLAEDIGRRFRQVSVLNFRRSIKYLMPFIDVSSSVWHGNYDPDSPVETYLSAKSHDKESLFYVFNTLQSPSPSVKDASDRFARQAITDVLDGTVHGLKTELYPYQRRSAAMMIRREAAPAWSLDPRKALHHGPTGDSFYFDKEAGVLLREPHRYEEPRGGILAETMGYGKTLICIALILATRGHFPRIPEGGQEQIRGPRKQTASLLQMAAAHVTHCGMPWKAEFHSLGEAGEHYDHCIKELQKCRTEYQEPLFTPTNPARGGKGQSEKVVRLCSSTLVIVPANLLVQWQYEISRHTEKDALDILVVDHTTKIIPPVDELRKCDIVLITKARFEQEYRSNDFYIGRPGKGQKCFPSPLTDLRWLRVIFDEGHGFASPGAKTNAVAMLDKMYIERRWVVSGTPSSSLSGVEVGLAAEETVLISEPPENRSASALEARRPPDGAAQEAKDLEKLRFMVTDILKVHPWVKVRGADQANWRRYLNPCNPDTRAQKTACLRTILQSLIVRHRIEDIEIDLSLPPLYNKVAYLEPSYYDKLSINLFVSSLASNAVTSERVDKDYMFHPKNRKQLDRLIRNLRQSSFHWVGFKREDILGMVRESQKYLKEQRDKITASDWTLLTGAINSGERALRDTGWQALSNLNEIGVWVEDFPPSSARAWALNDEAWEPLLMGTVQARLAQTHIHNDSKAYDPAEGLTGAGLRAMQATRKRAAEENARLHGSTMSAKSAEEPKLRAPTTMPRVRSTSPGGRPARKHSRCDSVEFKSDPDSPLSKSKIVGFSSSKLTYLMDRVQEHQSTEKTIIFYDSNHVAFWIAEGLELLSVKFLIYSNTLAAARRATYLATFNQKDEFRVLLMDLKQASHGLHVAAASRVFIVSPIWQPSVESQAIKRAHRIGQTKPVYVETLVLRNTLEDRILQRRKHMSNLELRQAEKSLLDDGIMNQIIKDEGFITFEPRETHVQGRVARLGTAQPLFGRAVNAVDEEVAENELVLAAGDVLTPRKKRKRGVAASPTGSKEPL